MEISIEDMQKKFEELPEDLRWAIMAANVDEKIAEIGSRDGLNVEQMGKLELEVNATLFGFYPSDKFQDSLKISLGFPDDRIKLIVDDVNEMIFKKVREELKNSSEGIEETAEEKDQDVLQSAGIKITPTSAPAVEKEAPLEKREDMLAVVEKPELAMVKENKPTAPSILESKLSGSFKMPSAKTEYSLGNISKASAPVAGNVNKTAPSIDPYRMPIDDK